MTHKTSCSDLAAAMFTLARDIECEDGVANAAILEAGERIQELSWQAGVLRELLAWSVISLREIVADDQYEQERLNELVRKIEAALKGSS